MRFGAVRRLARLEQQAWDDLPDFGSDPVKHARFLALHEALELFRPCRESSDPPPVEVTMTRSLYDD